jgi:hypothetical protein
MNNPNEPVELLFKRVEDYSKTTIELLKLQAIKKSAEMLSSMLGHLSIVLATTLAVLLINFGLAIWVGNLFHSTFYGFFIVGGIYAILALLLYFYKAIWIEKPIKNFLITQLRK